MNCLEEIKKPRPQIPDVKTVLVVAAALVNSSGSVLIAQRPPGKSMSGLWEFPGGKINPGETPEYALMRELHEELGIETRPCCFTPVSVASHTYTDFHLLMPLFACRVWGGEPRAIEHTAIEWVNPHDLYNYPMPPADVPLIVALKTFL
jgi:8-oxo-dGTP diphosphatase